MNHKWEWIEEDMFRLKVPGGWLYRWHNTQPVFVPNKLK